MPWSSDFVTALSSRTRGLRFLIQVLEVDGVPGTAFTMRSVVAPGDVIGIARVNETPATINPRGWSSTCGAFNATLAGDISAFLACATRGTILELYAGFEGWDEADFERIAVGALRNVRNQGGPAYELEVLDLFSAFRGRCDTNYGSYALAAGLSSSNIDGGDWDPGTSPTTLQVTSTSSFERETGQDGLVLVTPTTGDPFYVRWSGTSGGTTFTGITFGGGTAVHGTIAVEALDGDRVDECFYVKDHPVNIARKVITSTGAGTNGTYDTLPSAWGLAVPDELVDHDDCDATMLLMGGSFTPYDWEAVLTAQQNNALSWLQSGLSRGGFVLTMRQGCVTVRAAIDTSTATPEMDITDADIERIEDYDAFAFDHPDEYALVQSIYEVDSGPRPGATVNDVATLPMAVGTGDLAILTLDLGSVVFGGQATNIVDETMARIEESARRVPERLRIRCAGLRTATLCAPTVVTLTTTKVQSRRDGLAGFSARPALVVSVARDWSRGSVQLELRVYPESEAEFA